MKPAFLDNNLREKYIRILNSWRGTPYRHLVIKKGRGADCTLLVGATWIELGILKKLEYDHYPRAWHMNTTKEWVLEGFQHHIDNHIRSNYCMMELGILEEKDFMFGDIITFATTAMKVSNHCGIWMDERKTFFNSIGRRGCCGLTYGSYWDLRQTGVYRIMEK